MNHHASSDKITSQMTLSERADHLEEQMMHELDHVITKSVFSHLTDGKVEMEGGAALQAKYPGKYFNMSLQQSYIEAEGSIFFVLMERQ